MNTFLITGGSGFLGYHTARSIIQNETESRVLLGDLVAPSWLGEFHGKVDWIELDIANIDDTISNIGCNDVTHVIHLAGILGTMEQVFNPVPSFEINTLATIKLLDRMRRETPETPLVLTVNGNGEWYNTYAISKEAAGRVAIMFNREFGTRYTVVRPFNAFGEYQKAKPIRKIGPHMITRALLGQDIEIFGSGAQSFDLVYAGDVAEVLYRAATVSNSRDYGVIIEAGSGEEITPVAFARRVIEMTGSSSQLRHLPMRAGEPENTRLCADVKSLGQVGMAAGGLRGFDEAFLGKTIEWYAARITAGDETYIDQDEA